MRPPAGGRIVGVMLRHAGRERVLVRDESAGVALLRGLFRLDAARSIDAFGGWRVNFYAVARF